MEFVGTWQAMMNVFGCAPVLAGPNLFRLLPPTTFPLAIRVEIHAWATNINCPKVLPLSFFVYSSAVLSTLRPTLRPPSASFSSRLVIVAGVPARALNCFIMLDVIMPAVQFAAGRGCIPLATYLPQSLAVACPSTQFSCTLCALLWSDSASRLLHSIRLLYLLLSFASVWFSTRARGFQIKMALHI